MLSSLQKMRLPILLTTFLLLCPLCIGFSDCAQECYSAALDAAPCGTANALPHCDCEMDDMDGQLIVSSFSACVQSKCPNDLDTTYKILDSSCTDRGYPLSYTYNQFIAAGSKISLSLPTSSQGLTSTIPTPTS